MIFRNRISILTLSMLILATSLLEVSEASEQKRIAQQEAVQLSPEQQFLSLQKKAAQGDAEAQTDLGVKYIAGNGVPKNADQAVEWFQKAAAQGYAYAQLFLVWMYAKGEDVPKDAAQAVAWYQKAAAQGNADAQNNLGAMYGRGEGMPKDTVQAVAWYQKAAAQGLAEAQYNLGVVYATGEGVAQDQDNVLAYAWLNLAAVSGNDQSVKRRDLYESTLSSVEKNEAQRLSSAWKKGQVLRR